MSSFIGIFHFLFLLLVMLAALGCSGCLLACVSFPCPNIGLYGLAPVVWCSVDLYALIPLRNSSWSDLACNVVILAIWGSLSDVWNLPLVCSLQIWGCWMAGHHLISPPLVLQRYWIPFWMQECCFFTGGSHKFNQGVSGVLAVEHESEVSC